MKNACLKGISLVVILLNLGLFVAPFYVIYIPNVYSNVSAIWAIIHSAIFAFMVILTIWTYLAVLCKDPGYVKIQSK